MKGEKNTPFKRSSIDHQVFAETRNFIALYNVAPIVPGHSLVVPKRYVKSLFELDDSELCEFMLFGRQVASILCRAFNTDAFDWCIQEGKEAGQTVSHLHLHVIPRKPKDLTTPGDWYAMIDSESRSRLSRAELIETVNYIKKFMADRDGKSVATS